MNQEKITMLKEFLKLGNSPILLENISPKVFEDAIVLEANCDLSLLNGHYEGIDFVAPDWYQKLTKQTPRPLLIINELNQIPSNEQTKFIEILKYKKISTFDLPKGCLIIVICSNLKGKPINEEVYSLLAHI